MSAKLVPLICFPRANYLAPGTEAERGHMLAIYATTGRALPVRLLAEAVYWHALECGRNGELDYTRSLIVHDMLFSFVELLDYDRGGWDAGTCDAWARSVGEYIGQPLD
jgi:hypothetical protein